MCGRYRLSRRKQFIEEHFDSVSGEEEWTPRYNIAPTQPIPVIRQNPKEPIRELSLMRWGLIPSWAKGCFWCCPDDQRKIGNSEHEASVPRCDEIPQVFDSCRWFYEWMRTGKTKQPYCFEVSEGELFAFAGLWDRWRDPSGNWIKTCSILTTTPNAVASTGPQSKHSSTSCFRRDNR
jgi:putative SOS response-associated peptidase YedK